MQTQSKFPQKICEDIWNMKYKLVTPNPDIEDDTCVQDTWDRIAKACAEQLESVEEQQSAVRRFRRVLEDFHFLPGGRIIAGAGTGRLVTLFNCYVMGTIPDSLTGIFDMLKEAALTMQQGGGIGYDFSTIRPKGALVKKVDADASGPLSFMDVWDAMCRTIMSAGNRRGAMMATMDVTHPDVVEFIQAKKESGRLRNFNMSVLVTDQFMDAVRQGHNWVFSHKAPPSNPHPNYQNGEKITPSGDVVYEGDYPYIYGDMPACELFEIIMKSTYEFAEPGVIFIDAINKNNNLWSVEEIRATNPCGEQPLPPYGACLLGSLNVTKFITNPFTAHAGLNKEALRQATFTAVEMLDNVIDISNFPLPEQEKEAKEKRRMGLGITGIANAMFMVGMRYGNARAKAFMKEVMCTITNAAYLTSARLAKAKGPCPILDPKLHPDNVENFLRSTIGRRLPEGTRNLIKQYGLRNTHLISIAPTGTISLFAGNLSGGIEPAFAKGYSREVTQPDGSKVTEYVQDYSLHLLNSLVESGKISEEFAKNWKEEFWVDAQTLTPKQHVDMQAAAQIWVDSSISKTVNLPEDISFEDFKEVYQYAYEQGCKGCTTYRPNDILGSVLSVKEDKGEETKETEEENQQQADEAPSNAALGIEPLPRPEALDGTTYKLKWNDDTIYLNITNCEHNGELIPFEIFINAKNPSNIVWTSALTRMMSAVFRRGGDVSFVIEDLKSIHDPAGGIWQIGKYIPSLPALIGVTLERHLKSLDTVTPETKELTMDTTPSLVEPKKDTPPVETRGVQCPSCFGYNVQKSGGCLTCQDCGDSKCG